jgi:hypothetical protein
MARSAVRQLVINVGKVLADDWRVATYPDHPHAYHTPQIIAGFQGNLLAVFVPTRSEERSPSRLLSRLSIARLALPAHARFVLVLPKEAQFRNDILHNFEAVISGSELRTLPRVGLSQDSRRSARQDLDAVQAETNRRYNTFLRASRRRWSSTPIRREAATQRRQLLAVIEKLGQASIRYAPGGFVEYDLNYAVIVASRRHVDQRVQRHIAALTLDTIKQSYSLDAGVPYLRRRTPYVLLVDQWPMGTFDPGKPARAAAFSGVAIARPESPEDLLRFADRLASLAERMSR